MTILKNGICARRWFWPAVLAALICFGLAATNAVAQAPAGGASKGAAPAGTAPAARPKSDRAAPSAPLVCNNPYVITTSSGAIDPGVNDIGNHTDDGVTNIALPFTFTFYDQAFTGVGASSNGNLQFMGANGYWVNSCLPTPPGSQLLNNAILPYWEDQLTTGPGEGIFTSVVGVAPNRVFNIEWRTHYFSGGGTANYEVRLYEAPGANGGSRFDVVYGTATEGNTGATVGAQRDTGSQFTQYVCDGVGGAISSGLVLRFEQNCAGPTFTSTRTPTITRTPTNTPTVPPCGPGGNYLVDSTTGASIIPGTTDIGNHTDDGTTAIVLPFAFNFYGTAVTGANVSSNGNVQFTGANSNYLNTCLPDGTFNNTIFPFWDDQRTDITGTVPSGIFTGVQGVSPNRTFIIEWRTVYFNTTTSLNYEVLLHEGPEGAFDVVYGAMNGTGTSATVGAQKGTGAGQFTQYECNTGGISDGQKLAFQPLGCGSNTPTHTNTPTRTNTPTLTNTPTQGLTPTPTATTSCTPAGYSFSTSTGAGIIPGTTDIGNHTDDGTTAIALPFTFNFYGTPFDSAHVSSNGNVQFTGANANFNNACLPDTTFIDAIFPHWDDQRTDQVGTGCGSFGSGCGIFTAVQGVSPNRTFIIEWRTVYFNPDTTSLNYELILHEGATGSFDMIYGNLNGTGAGATVGAQRDTGSIFNQFECDTAGTLSQGLMISATHAAGNCPTNTPTHTVTPTRTPTPTSTPICPGDWTAQALYLSNIMDNAVAPGGGFVYSFGGYDGTDVVANAYKYDPGSNTWSPIMPLPAARQAARAVSDGAYIYILGGWDTAGAATNTLYRYDPAGNSYLAMAPFTQGVAAPGVAYLVVGGNGKIYKVGGCIDISCTLTGISEVYNIPTNTWAPIASYPAAISWLMATGITGGVNAGKVLAAGGTDSDTTATNKTYVYDPGANTWNDGAAPDLPDDGLGSSGSRWAAASDMVKTRWVLVGGVLADFSTVTNTAIAYDPSANSWSVMDPMPVARYRMAGGTVGTAPGSAALYVVGGSSGGFAPTADNQRFLDICQPTQTPTPGRFLVVHVTWQGIPQPNSRNTTETVTTTLRLTGGGPATEYTGYATDASGYFTLPVGSLPNGTYGMRVKGPRNLSSGSGVCTDTVTLTGVPVTTHESGLMRAGDAVSSGSLNFNVVNATDFTTLKSTFGKSYGQPGYDARADFDNTDVVNSTDFTLLRGNFGQAGCGPALDPGDSPKVVSP